MRCRGGGRSIFGRCREAGYEYSSPCRVRCRRRSVVKSYDEMRIKNMAILDWSQCPAVESVPGRLSGAWVFRDTRMPVSAVFENLEAGATIEEIIEQFDITREQINAVLEFAARSLDPVRVHASSSPVDAHSL
jgi:uncharacterized protein (DUF433 family)